MENLNRPAAEVTEAEGQSQDCPATVQAQECGESEGQLVTSWIAVESKDNITTPEREQTSARSIITREFEIPSSNEDKGEQMTPAQQSGAPLPHSAKNPASAASSASEVEWHAIEWQAVDRSVRRLQMRIVKATKDGRWNKVKYLQRLLTHSFHGKAQAVRRVTENTGSRTAGVDGEKWRTPRSKSTRDSEAEAAGLPSQTA